MKPTLLSFGICLLLLCGLSATGFSIVNPISNPQLTFSGDTTDSIFFKNSNTGKLIAVGSGRQMKVWPTNNDPVVGHFKGVCNGKLVMEVKGEEQSFVIKDLTKVLLPSSPTSEMLGAFAILGAVGALSLAVAFIFIGLILGAFSFTVLPLLLLSGVLFLTGDHLGGRMMRLTQNWRRILSRKSL